MASVCEEVGNFCIDFILTVHSTGQHGQQHPNKFLSWLSLKSRPSTTKNRYAWYLLSVFFVFFEKECTFSVFLWRRPWSKAIGSLEKRKMLAASRFHIME